MNLKAFAVHDIKAEQFMAPFFMQTTGQAIRAWETTVNDPKTEFNKYPGDFTLFEIGEFDGNKGTLVPYVSPRNIGLALEFKKDPIATTPLQQMTPEMRQQVADLAGAAGKRKNKK